MLNINEDIIKKGCFNDEIYRRGLRYYNEGRVKNVKVEENTIYARVIGAYDYEVRIDIDRLGNIEYSECECPAFSSYLGYCKHIVAVFLYLMNNQFDFSKQRDEKIASYIINYFDIEPKNIKEYINIEINLDIKYKFLETEPKIFLWFKIGNQKMYIVKNIGNFIECIINNKPVEFSKLFTYDSQYYSFNKEDNNIIDFLLEIYELNKNFMLNNTNYTAYIFNEKNIVLYEILIKKFLEIVKAHAFNINILDKTYKNVIITQNELPISFYIESDNQNILLNIDILEELIPITKDLEYIFYKGNIYRLNQTKRNCLQPFFYSIIESKNNCIKFNNKYSEEFVSLILPNIKKACKVIIDDKFTSVIYEKPAVIKLYFDRYDKRITLIINFIYGEYTINPYNKDLNVKDDNIIIIRDYDKEKEILNEIEKADFKINKDEVYLDDDDKIFELISFHIPRMQKKCEIFYSDAFKSMKIISSTSFKSSIRLNNDTDLLEFDFSIDEVDKEEISLVFESFKEKKKYYRLSNGSYLPLENNIKNILDIMEYLDIDYNNMQAGTISIPKYKAIYIDEVMQEINNNTFDKNKALLELIDNIRKPENFDIEISDSYKKIMREYQIRGYKWLKMLSKYGFGGILADDMGLGKTLQAISYIESESMNSKLPAIVICPTSLIYNWEAEVIKFSSNLRILVINGNTNQREMLFNNINSVDLVITSFPLIRRDIHRYLKYYFCCCIVDEAQNIKNPNSINARAVKQIKASKYFALTGTPIENNLMELWSIFDFVMPGLLYTRKQFSEKFERPIVYNNNIEAANELKRYIEPFIMRRLKKDVLNELPGKIESVVLAELTEKQKIVYIAYLEQIKNKIISDINKNGYEKSHIQILAGLTRLRQICCHPSMFLENYTGDSGKMELLMELLKEIIEGKHRALIFSQFTTALHIIEKQLIKNKIAYFYLDGSIESIKRANMVKEFNSGNKQIFLISLKAGGTGLNLTGADTVIHFDPWWNPAVEEQATDRAYRLGQLNVVQVMKLITKGTIEEKIYNLQHKKKELINTVLQPGETFISKMNEKDIMEILNNKF